MKDMSKPDLKRMSKEVYKISLFQESVLLKTAYQKTEKCTLEPTSIPTLLKHTHTKLKKKNKYFLFFYFKSDGFSYASISESSKERFCF